MKLARACDTTFVEALYNKVRVKVAPNLTYPFQDGLVARPSSIAGCCKGMFGRAEPVRPSLIVLRLKYAEPDHVSRLD